LLVIIAVIQTSSCCITRHGTDRNKKRREYPLYFIYNSYLCIRM